MIKYNALDIKIIFKNIKNRLKTFQVLKQTYVLQNIKESFSKIVFQNYFRKQLPNKVQNSLRKSL